MTIRQAKFEDAFEIQALVFSLSHFYLESPNSLLPQWFKEPLTVTEFQKRLSDKDYVNIVYTEKGLIVGYLSIKNGNHIFHLFVDKDYQRQGISKQLWAYAITQSSNTTYTVRSSIYAIPVYKSFGFVITEAERKKDGLAYQSMKVIL